MTPPDAAPLPGADTIEPEKALPAPPVFLTRDQLVGDTKGWLEEAVVEVEGVGKVLVGELTGMDRAQIVSLQAQNLRRDKVDLASYQKQVLAKGILDPSSPPGARTPLLRGSDMDALMKKGGRKIGIIVDKIEELSGLKADAVSRAEGDSEETLSSDGSS